MTVLLSRITTVYDSIEDRVCLSGQAEPGVHVLFLTRRLLDALVPELCLWLVQQAGSSPHAEISQGLAQRRARLDLERLTPVQSQVGGASMLVRRLDLARSPHNVHLQFFSGEVLAEAELRLCAKPLRQWLNVLYDQYRRASWPLDVWPAWMVEEYASVRPRVLRQLH